VFLAKRYVDEDQMIPGAFALMVSILHLELEATALISQTARTTAINVTSMLYAKRLMEATYVFA
jgi:hypothetical protein